MAALVPLARRKPTSVEAPEARALLPLVLCLAGLLLWAAAVAAVAGESQTPMLMAAAA